MDTSTMEKIYAMIKTNMDQIDFLLTRRVDKIYPSKEELEKTLRSGKKLRIYQGFDPSSPTLHIGHLAGLKKLADFQAAGHEVIFLIGDFTGMIGDPTGKIEGARPQLTHEQVMNNAQTYKKQTEKILNFSGDNPVKIKYNGEWLSKLSAIEAFQLMHYLTFSQIIKRDMFQDRIQAGKDLFASELMYPFMQGYDSVAMDVDLEIGGSDQTFNMLVGRDLMHKIKQKEKFVLTIPLLVDSDGKKIGKTEGNAIAIADPPNILFKNVMTLPDDVIIPAFKLITDETIEKIEEYEKKIKKGENPINFKKLLAHTIVKELNNSHDADKAQEEFERSVQGREVPENIPAIISSNPSTNHIVMIQIGGSMSEAKRLIQQRAVEVNGKIVTDQKEIRKSGDIVKTGKKKYGIVKLIDNKS